MVIDHATPGCSSSPDIQTLMAALAKAQASYKPIKRSALFDGGEGRQFRYPTWKDITDALYGPLLANGLVFLPRQSIGPDGRWIMVGMLYHHPSSEWISSTAPIRDVISDYGERGDSQSYEIACTYAKKNLLQTLAGGFTDDGEEVVGSEVQAEPQPEAAQPEVVDPEVARLDAQRLKIETACEQFKDDPAKMQKFHTKMADLVATGDLRSSDCKDLKKKFPIPSPAPKKEKASAK